MIFVVNDACFLIDLLDIDLLDEFFQLDLQPHITPSVLAELEGDIYEKPLRDGIKQKKLFLQNLSGDDQNEIFKLMLENSSLLSEPDCSCLYLAEKIQAIILTCEKLLTKTARNLGIEVHGSLWVLDQLIASSIITRKTAHRKLTKLISINDRMPRAECKKRLKQWS